MLRHRPSGWAAPTTCRRARPSGSAWRPVPDLEVRLRPDDDEVPDRVPDALRRRPRAPARAVRSCCCAPEPVVPAPVRARRATPEPPELLGARRARRGRSWSVGRLLDRRCGRTARAARASSAVGRLRVRLLATSSARPRPPRPRPLRLVLLGVVPVLVVDAVPRPPRGPPRGRRRPRPRLLRLRLRLRLRDAAAAPQPARRSADRVLRGARGHVRDVARRAPGLGHRVAHGSGRLAGRLRGAGGGLAEVLDAVDEGVGQRLHARARDREGRVLARLEQPAAHRGVEPLELRRGVDELGGLAEQRRGVGRDLLPGERAPQHDRQLHLLRATQQISAHDGEGNLATTHEAVSRFLINGRRPGDLLSTRTTSVRGTRLSLPVIGRKQPGVTFPERSRRPGQE